jgi:hypothetical protein
MYQERDSVFSFKKYPNITRLPSSIWTSFLLWVVTDTFEGHAMTFPPNIIRKIIEEW